MDETVKKELFDYLNADAALTALVSARIFPVIAPASAAYPSVTVTRVFNEHTRHMLASGGLSIALYQIDTWALSSPSAESVAEAVRNLLDGYVTKDMGGVDVRSSFLDLEEDTVETPQDGSQDFIYRIRQDYKIIHGESIPTP